MNIDVLCVGHASYDLIFSVAQHPKADEKIVAEQFIACGGGPAANAAVQIARLGGHAAFAGYLGLDVYGAAHLAELTTQGVNTDYVVRGNCPTPLSTIIVKPQGQRALINYKGETEALAENAIDFSHLTAKVVLFDGHEPHISVPLAQTAMPTVLDAGSVHEGTLALMGLVDYLVCSEKFALQLKADVLTALSDLASIAPFVVITLGEHGLLWQHGAERGTLPALSIDAIDTTGAGDAFHGAFSLAVANQWSWLDSLRYASVAGSLCCTKMGARLGLASHSEHSAVLNNLPKEFF